ncbi:uncharacterized protein LOC100116734 isoform X1 [Nasonia vitripennis]|uniref:Uncharacterized protein n=1 Tax=Nasonia vitripennis TaxID=7425 RepID=A0A7M7QIX8_NASVI|nr:uncharacterized protein LOC100116734 isoform X1 [Nasonia vitripennis]
MKKIVFIISTFCFVMIQGIRKELNPKKINLTEFTEAMQSCGTMLGFDREFKLHLFGSQEDYNKTLCLSFCALRKLKFYVIEDEIKKELAHVRNARLKEEVYKALDVCKHRKRQLNKSNFMHERLFTFNIPFSFRRPLQTFRLLFRLCKSGGCRE